jgi:hypothetical protein
MLIRFLPKRTSSHSDATRKSPATHSVALEPWSNWRDKNRKRTEMS